MNLHFKDRANWFTHILWLVDEHLISRYYLYRSTNLWNIQQSRKGDLCLHLFLQVCFTIIHVRFCSWNPIISPHARNYNWTHTYLFSTCDKFCFVFDKYTITWQTDTVTEDLITAFHILNISRQPVESRVFLYPILVPLVLQISYIFWVLYKKGTMPLNKIYITD